MNNPIYNICGKCCQVEPAPRWSRDSDDQLQCMHCKTVNDFSAWPGEEILDFLGFIRNYDPNSPNYGQVIGVFTCSVLELMLEELVTKMAYENLTYEQGFMLIDALFEAYQGRSRLLSLYKRVGYGSFQEEAERFEHSEFITNWNRIVVIRNKVVHGKLQEGNQITAALIYKTLDDALSLFSQLHNLYNVESLDYELAVRPDQLSE